MTVNRGSKSGCGININRAFFKYRLARRLVEIGAEMETVEGRTVGVLRELTE